MGRSGHHSTLGTETVGEDVLACAPTMAFDSRFSARTGVVGIAKLKTGYQHDHVTLVCDENLDIAGLRGAQC